MVCIYCYNPTQVVNSRLQKKSNNIWRRRKCVVCAAVFTTQEQVRLSSSFVVAKQPGAVNLSPFHREILFLSITQACGHRQDAIKDAIELTETIITALPFSKQGTITTNQIADTSYEILSRFDKVAATYYRAYHLDR